MRVGSVGHDHVCQGGHRIGDIGVQIQRDTDWQLITGNGAQATKQFAFAVVHMRGHHGAVQA